MCESSVICDLVHKAADALFYGTSVSTGRHCCFHWYFTKLGFVRYNKTNMPCQCGYPDGMSPLGRMVFPMPEPSAKPSSRGETFHQDTLTTGMAYLYNVVGRVAHTWLIKGHRDWINRYTDCFGDIISCLQIVREHLNEICWLELTNAPNKLCIYATIPISDFDEYYVIKKALFRRNLATNRL